MPLYEYRCEACEERFEILQRMGEGADGLTCPSCGDVHLAKQHSTFAASGGEATSFGDASAAAACERPGCGAGAGFG